MRVMKAQLENAYSTVRGEDGYLLVLKEVTVNLSGSFLQRLSRNRKKQKLFPVSGPWYINKSTKM